MAVAAIAAAAVASTPMEASVAWTSPLSPAAVVVESEQQRQSRAAAAATSPLGGHAAVRSRGKSASGDGASSAQQLSATSSRALGLAPLEPLEHAAVRAPESPATTSTTSERGWRRRSAPAPTTLQPATKPWDRPLSLPLPELVRCVYLRARHDFQPTSAWMHQCFDAAERQLWAVAAAGASSGGAAAALGLEGSGATSLDSKELFQLVWGLARLHELHLQRERRRGSTAQQQQCTTAAAAAAPVLLSATSSGPVLGLFTNSSAPHLWGPPPHHHDDDDDGFFGGIWSSWSGSGGGSSGDGQGSVAGRWHGGGGGAVVGSHVLAHSLASAGLAPPPPASASAWQGPSEGFLAALEAASLRVALRPRPAAASGGDAQRSARQQRPGSAAGVAASPQLVASVPRCMVLLGLCPTGAWLQRWAHEVARPLLPRMGGRDASELAWSLAWLQHRPAAAWMRELVARAEELAVNRRLAPQVRELLGGGCEWTRLSS